MTVLKNDTQKIRMSGRLGAISYPWVYGKKLIYPKHHGAVEKLSSYQVYDYNTYYLTLDDFKESVTSGHFEPGVYRVNPYHVAKAHAQFAPCTYPLNVADGETVKYTGLEPALYEDEYPLWWIRDSVNGWWLFCRGTFWQVEMYQLANLSLGLRKRESFEQIALQKAYGKVSASDLNLGEDLGELRETIGMLREPLKALKKFLVDDRSRNLRLLVALCDYNSKTNRKEIAKLLGRTGEASVDATTGTWLELRYGFRPLYKLIMDVVERVQEKQKAAFDPTVIRSAKSKLRFGPYKTGYKYERLYSDKVSVCCDLLVEDTYTVNASVQYRQAFSQSFLDSLGLTPRFLPEVAWELTKLSFVWDWLISIGPWLASLRIQPGYNVLGNSVGFKSSRLITNGPPRLKAYHSKEEVLMEDAFHPDTDYYYRDEYERKVNLDLTYLPHFTWGRTLDLYKAIDSVSLIWQFLAKYK